MSSFRILELRNQIIKAKQAYYYGARPIMSDAAFDALEDELRELNPNDEVLAIVGAPVPPDAILTKARHSIPMGSQGKVNTQDEFLTWYEKSANCGALHASLKGDGASAAAYYENGRLVQAISRGDGFEGEDITANAVKFKGLPALAFDSEGRAFTGAVRFEVILTIADWAQVDPERSKNPRNAGSGIMGRKNGEQAELLSIYAFDIDEQRAGTLVAFQDESAKSSRLAELGFELIPHRICDDAASAVAYYQEVTQTRERLPFWIDGVVFKVNELERQRSLGVTANRPKGQVAWKFDSKGAETTLLSYSVSVGHTGALIPNAQLSPVEIGGTTVQNALLNNWDEIARLGVAVGDRVWLIKANDIIPKVVAVRAKGRNRKSIAEPTTCPACDSPVARRKNSGGEEGAVIECTNDDCPARSVGKIKRWIRSLDIQGIGDSVRLALVDRLGLEDAAGLYRLRENTAALANLVINDEKDLRLGDKRAATILEHIERTRQMTLVQFLGSLGIDRLAKRRVELMISQARGALDQLDDWRAGKLREAEFAAQVGVPTVGAGIQESLDTKSELIDQLLEAGVEIVATGVVHPEPGSDEGRARSVCISGKLPSGSKKGDYEEPLTNAGFELVSSVTKDLSYLVIADPTTTSSKAQKARKYGVKVISEDELRELIASAPEVA